MHTYKETTKKGQEAKQKGEESSENGQVTQSYTAKELGVGGSRQIPKQSKLPGQQPQSKYVENVRGGNIAKYMQQNPNAELSSNAQQTYDSYAKQIKNKGEKNEFC